MRPYAETTKIYGALLEVQKEIRNPENSAVNPFAKSKYAPLNEILNMVRPLLNKNGLILIQNTGTDDGVAYVQTIIAHESGEELSFDRLYLKDERQSNPVQAMGSAISYGRRYQLTSILGIAGEEDTDGNVKAKPKNNEERKKPAPKSNKTPKPKSAKTPKKPKPPAKKNDETTYKPDLFKDTNKGELVIELLKDEKKPLTRKNINARAVKLMPERLTMDDVTEITSVMDTADKA